nr:hypothetical protein 10 [Desulfobacterales bacterium]
MKIKDESDGFDIKEEKFWHDVGSYLRFGIPAHDKRGHSSEVRFRVRPVQLDIVGKIRDQMPENSYKTNAALYRGLLAVGCKCALEYLKKEKTDSAVKAMDKLIEGLNKLSKQSRLQELEKDIESAQQDVLRGSLEDKTNIIELLDRMKKDVRKMQGDR